MQCLEHELFFAEIIDLEAILLVHRDDLIVLVLLPLTLGLNDSDLLIKRLLGHLAGSGGVWPGHADSGVDVTALVHDVVLDLLHLGVDVLLCD